MSKVKKFFKKVFKKDEHGGEAGEQPEERKEPAFVCTEGQHKDIVIPCMNCGQTKVCTNCANVQGRDMICKLCLLSIQNLNNDSDSDGMEFNSGAGIHNDVHVGFDRESESVTGWDAIWSMIQIEDQEKAREYEQTLNSGVGAFLSQERASNTSLAKGPLSAQEAELGGPSQVNAGISQFKDYEVIEHDMSHFTLRCRTDHSQTVDVSISEGPGDSIIWHGLPDCLRQELAVFSQQEVSMYPATLLKVILSQLYQPKQALKDSGEIEKQLKHAANIVQQNPSQYYKVVGKVGEGGFARVFRCQRFSDGKFYALKFTEPKTAKER